MGLYKQKYNSRTGTWNLVPAYTVIHFKAGVATYNDLPITGNAIGDGRITNDTGHLYIWSIDASGGALTDWVDQGDIIDINWDDIIGKPSSTPAEIDAIVDNGIVSVAAGNEKKIISMTYNVITGQITITYEV